MATSIAHGYTCGGPADTVIPGPLETAPLNTHVWVYIQQSDAKYCTERSYGVASCEDTVRLELWTAPSAREAPRVVASTIHRHATELGDADEGFVYEIVPTSPLAPNARYEIWSVEERNRLPDVLRGTIKTGSKRDDAPPTWSGEKRLMAEPPAKPVKRKGRRIEITLREWSGLRLFGDNAEDAEGRVLYAVWVPNPDGTFDYSRPAAGHAWAVDEIWRKDGFLGTLGWPGWCAPSNFKVPERGGKPLRLGLAAVDLAGNRSQTVEVEVH